MIFKFSTNPEFHYHHYPSPSIHAPTCPPVHRAHDGHANFQHRILHSHSHAHRKRLTGSLRSVTHRPPQRRHTWLPRSIPGQCSNPQRGHPLEKSHRNSSATAHQSAHGWNQASVADVFCACHSLLLGHGTVLRDASAYACRVFELSRVLDGKRERAWGCN